MADKIEEGENISSRRELKKFHRVPSDCVHFVRSTASPFLLCSFGILRPSVFPSGVPNRAGFPSLFHRSGMLYATHEEKDVERVYLFEAVCGKVLVGLFAHITPRLLRYGPEE